MSVNRSLAEARTTAESARIVLAGNPNSGKSTIFNAATGARQHVGNYPGVTVEKKVGQARARGLSLRITDVPGMYSLSASSLEERVARDVLIEGNADALVVVADASNLERHLYLAVQLIELGRPVVLALNMWDAAEHQGHEIDPAGLSACLGVPAIPVVGHKGRGIGELLDAAAAACLLDAGRVRGSEEIAGSAAPLARGRVVDYGPELEVHIARLAGMVSRDTPDLALARAYAILLLEGDEATNWRFGLRGPGGKQICAEALALRSRIELATGFDAGTLVADRRYAFISEACEAAVRRNANPPATTTDRIDRVLLDRRLGLPIFGLLMYLVFQLTFAVGEPLMAGLESGLQLLRDSIVGVWPAGHADLLRSLVVDGIIGGVGGVLVFLPNILLLFLAIAFLEDTGYMARAAFLMDRLMQRIGLHGKSCIPMLIGFGCTIPAILATRTLETRRDRFTMILVLPLISCGARLPIYALLIPAFFPGAWRAPVLWMLYVTGIALVVAGARVLRATLLRGEPVPFVMELPPYRLPTTRSIALHMWERGSLFVQKAGTFILAASVLLWALSTWPRLPDADISLLEGARASDVQLASLAVGDDDRLARGAMIEFVAAEFTTVDSRNVESGAVLLVAPDPEMTDSERANRAAEIRLEHSAMGRIGRVIEPVMQPLGFDWKISTAMLSAFAAKEVFVAQLGVVQAVGSVDETSDTLRDRLRASYTPLIGLCIMLFCLIGLPCMATVAATRRETGSWKWAALQLGGLTALAWGLTAAVYQVGVRILG